MKTGKKYIDNLKNNTITTSMLESALYSVNKRAKNWRDKAREYRLIGGYYSYENISKATEKKESLYEQKETLLSVAKPVCIHKEFAGYKRTRVYDYEQDYDKKYFTAQLKELIVWRNCYYDYEKDREVHFFDVANYNEPDYRYYLYYGLGMHTFHTPIDDPNDYSELSVVEIGELITTGHEIDDLMSLQFVNKIIDVINSKNFTYVEDIKTELPVYNNHIHEVEPYSFEFTEFMWCQLWRACNKTIRNEIKKIPYQIRELTDEEKKTFKVNVKTRRRGQVEIKVTGGCFDFPRPEYAEIKDYLLPYLTNTEVLSKKDIVAFLFNENSPVYETAKKVSDDFHSQEVYRSKLAEDARKSIARSDC